MSTAGQSASAKLGTGAASGGDEHGEQARQDAAHADMDLDKARRDPRQLRNELTRQREQTDRMLAGSQGRRY